MEEQIKQIMINNQENQPDSDFYDYDKSAKEISDHFERFSIWHGFWADFDTRDDKYFLDSTNEWYSFSELYTYWKDNFETLK